MVGALHDCLGNCEHLQTKLKSKFSKASIITKMETYKSQKKEKQSYENWDTEGSGRGFLLWDIKT